MHLKLLGITLLLTLTAGCQNPTGKLTPDATLVLKSSASYDIEIIEPSDLYFDAEANVLLTVSDSKSKIYKISTTGAILSDLKIDITNLEGICYGKNRSICVVDELARTVSLVDSSGNTLSQHVISIDDADANNGLEGIAYATFNDHYYLINEQNPDLLIETDAKFTQLTTYQLSFAEDYSGICVDNKNKNLWIVSDISESVTRCDMQGNPIASYKVSVKNAEGIAYDPDTGNLYLVSDSKSKLYLYSTKNIE